MAPNSRPPLTSRIRASFEGKRSNSKSEVTSPIQNGFITQNPDGLRTAIDEAINGETFQKAIAANLAKLIKPSIKSALDTIQPVVEAVYSHEILLRKTNRSVEDILSRLDERSIIGSRRESTVSRQSVINPLGSHPIERTPTRPADGSDRGSETPTQETPDPIPETTTNRDTSGHRQLLEEYHGKTTSSLAELSSSVEASNGKIAETLQGINDVGSKLHSTSEDVALLKSASEQSNTTLAVLQAQIDQLKEDIGGIMAAVGTDLGKNVQAGLASNSEGFTNLGSQITTVLSTLEGHAGTLGEIKDKGPHPEIIGSLQQLYDSHATHTTTLGEIKERSLAAPTAAVPESVKSDSTAALQDLKSDLAALRENIQAGLASNDENVTNVGIKVDTVLSTIEGHKALDQSADILAAVQQSNESHASHTSVLEDLKSREAAPAAAIDTTDLTTRIDSISDVMNTHTATLDEIRTAGGSHASVLEEIKAREVAPTPAATVDTNGLASQIGSISETLNAHTATLEKIEATGGAHAAALESHGSALEGLKSVGDEPASAPANVDISGLEGHIAAITATLETHTASLEVLKNANGAHATALEQSRSAGDDVHATGEGNAHLESQMNAIVTTLQAHSTALEEISTANQSHTSTLNELQGHGRTHALALAELKSLHIAALDDLKSPGIAPIASMDSAGLAALEIQLGSITRTLEVQTSAIKALSPQKSDEDNPASFTEITHASTPNGGFDNIMNNITSTLETHTSLLNEMKEDISAEILTTLHDLSQSQVNQTNLLTEIREADVSEEILTLLHASGENHASHATVLGELKSRAIDIPAPGSTSSEGVEAKIDGLVAVLEEHKASLDDIKGATTAANELHAGHTASLDELKSRSIDISAIPDIRGVEGKIDSMIALLEEHKSALADIKDTAASSHELHTAHGTILDGLKSSLTDIPPAVAAVDLSGLEAQLGAITSAFEEHKTTLSELKVLHTSHGASLEDIKSRSVESAPAPV